MESARDTPAPVSAGSRCSRMCSKPSMIGARSSNRLDSEFDPRLDPRAIARSSSLSLTTAAAPTYRGMSGSEARKRSKSLTAVA